MFWAEKDIGVAHTAQRSDGNGFYPCLRVCATPWEQLKWHPAHCLKQHRCFKNVQNFVRIEHSSLLQSLSIAKVYPQFRCEFEREESS